MPNPAKSHITLILDRSGSMESIRTDVIGAVNRFIDDQKAVAGACTLTLVQFDTQSPYEVISDGPIANAKKLTGEMYVPRGGTPLLDAIGRGIVDLGAKLAAMPEQDRPGKVFFVVETDGEENSSREYARDRLALMIKEQSEKYKWQFVFLGANQDAILTSKGLNLSAATSMSYAATGAGVQNANALTSRNIAACRSAGPDVSIAAFSAADRTEAMEGGA